jgi:murein L,D-transpeptidase YafK
MQRLLLLSVVALAVLGAHVPGPGAAERAPPTLTAEKVLVLKGARRLLLIDRGKAVRAYPIALGRNPKGHKAREGDGRTPEGVYLLDGRNLQSRFHRSIHISYPNGDDRARARRLGVAAGGDIMIHGLPNGRDAIGAAHARWNWTEGCIAVTNAEMDEIWTAVADGTVIEIRP